MAAAASRPLLAESAAAWQGWPDVQPGWLAEYAELSLRQRQAHWHAFLCQGSGQTHRGTAAVKAPAQYTQPQFVTVTVADGALALRLPAAAQRLGRCIIVVLHWQARAAQAVAACRLGARHGLLRLKSKFSLCWPASAFQVQLEVELTAQPALPLAEATAPARGSLVAVQQQRPQRT